MRLATHLFVFLLLLSFTTQPILAQFGSGPGGSLGSGPGEDLGSGPGEDLGSTPGGSVRIENPILAEDIRDLFETIIDVVLIFAVPLIVFFIIYAGFLYVTARGNESTITKAHMALLFAVVGGLLILGAKVLIEVVQGTVDAVINS